jgi:hypothetical protein
MSVYFITCRTLNMVKIGYVDGDSRSVQTRLISLRVACPLDIALEMILPGGWEEEQSLHRHFRKDRVRGEWFWITEAIERLISDPPTPPAADELLERPFSELDQHERLERIQLERWLTRAGSETLRRRSNEQKRKRLLRELAELEAEMSA